MKQITPRNYNLSRSFSYFLLSAILAFTSIDKIYAQDTKGTEFWFSPPSERYTNYVCQLYFTGYYDATIVIDYVARPGQPCATNTVTLVGGTFQTVQLPFNAATCDRYCDSLETPEVVSKNGIRITSTAPIAVYYIHYEPASTEMVPILPVTKMGTTYVTTAYREITSASNDFNSRVTITAIENGTNINIQLPTTTWTSAYPTAPGMLRTPGSTWSITLNQGETYTFICNDNGQATNATAPPPAAGTIADNRGLNGVRITATKKISVLSGTDCTWIGDIQYPGCGACDLTATHLLPVDQWSTTHITTQTLVRANNTLPLLGNANSSISDYLWVTADQNATTVNITGKATATLNLPNANDFKMYESPGQGLVPTNPGATHHVLRSNNPISVMQMMKGWQCDNNGGADPSQMLVLPENTFAKDYIITNPNQYASNFIVFLVKNIGGPGNTSLSSMSLVANGTSVPIPSTWTQIGTEPYYYNRINIPGGAVIKVKGDSLFGFYASGSGGPGSYGYMGGASCGLKAFAHADTSNICSGNGAVVTLELDSTKFGGPVLSSISYTYTWTIQTGTTVVCSNTGSGPNPTSTCTLTAAGVYTGILHITDNAGCSAIDTFQIVVTSNLPAPAASNNSPVCVGGSVTLSSNSSVSGVTYNWTGPASYTASGQNQTISSVTSAMAGTYYVTTSINGCTGKDSTVVVVNAAPIASISGTSTVCTGGSSLLTAAGGTIYSWSTGATTTAITVTPTASSVYTVTVSNGVCVGSSSATFTVTIGSSLAASIAGNTTLCSGNSTTLTASGGSTYSWNTAQTGNSIVVSPSVTTSYSVTAVSGSCSADTSITVVVNQSPSASISGNTNICPGNTAALTASGGINYSWSNGQSTSTVTGLSAGSYTVTVSNGNGCSKALPVSVTNVPGPAATMFQTNVMCAGQCSGIASATASGGTQPYTYSWTSGQTTSAVNSLCAGAYTVSVTDVNGCAFTSSISITQPASALSAAPTSTQATCGLNDGTASANASGGTPTYSYLWSSGQATSTASGLGVGSYTVTVTDGNGCSTAQAVSVTNLNGPVATMSQTNILCNGQCVGTASAGVTGGQSPYTYLWSNSQSTSAISNLCAGNYTMVVSDASGCTDVHVISIAQPLAMAVNPTVINASCGLNDGSADANASGGTASYTYSWSNGQTSPTATGLAVGFYTVTVTDANGCTQTATAQVSNTNGPAITSSSFVSPLCNGNSNGSASVVATGSGLSYSWTPSAPNSSSVSGLGAGSYTVIVSDGSGCSTMQLFTLTQPPAIIATASATPASCGNSNGSAAVAASGGTGALSYSWNPGGQATASVNGLNSGNYIVTVTDANGCTQSAAAVVGGGAGPVAAAGLDATIVPGANSNISASGGGSYSWSPSAGLSCDTCANTIASPTKTTQYCVTVTDTSGCTDTDCMTITVEYPCPDNITIDLPTAFTPNGDGHNDVFLIAGLNNCVVSYSLIIFDRWGEKVFESTDVAASWDGIYRGRDLDPAVFVYYFSAVFTNDQSISKKGNISLIR